MNFDRKICVLGVAGGSASGKTTIINKVKEYFGNDIVVISHDSYYKAHDEMTFEERCKLNYDHPDSFESDRMVEDVRKLIKGYSVEVPVYDYCVYARSVFLGAESATGLRNHGDGAHDLSVDAAV